MSAATAMALGSGAPAAHTPAGDALVAEDLFAPGAQQVVLAGHPRAAGTEGGGSDPAAPSGGTAAHHPKEVLLALAGAAAAAAGLPVQRANPHFMPITAWGAGLSVAHFAALDLVCPVPLAHNTLLLDGEDLLALAEERRVEEQAGLQRRRCLLMDRLFSVVPPGLAESGALAELLPEMPVLPAPVGRLLGLAAALDGPAAPVPWFACDVETGPYNFLQRRRSPRLGTSHLAVLMDPVTRGGRPGLLAFASPRTLGELAPALRAFAALSPGGGASAAGPGAARGGQSSPLFFLLFFGTPEAFAEALAERPYATFFGDNFRCPGIRVLFAPFAPAEVLQAVRAADACVDVCYGGMLDALARNLDVPRRIVLGPDGRFDAWLDGRAVRQDIGWEAVLAPATLAARRHKADRSRERQLVEVMEAMLAPTR